MDVELFVFLVPGRVCWWVEVRDAKADAKVVRMTKIGGRVKAKDIEKVNNSERERKDVCLFWV